MKEANGLKVSAEVKTITVTQANLARALGLTPTRVNQLIDLDIVVRDDLDKSGGVFLFESVKNYYSSKQSTRDDDGKSVNYWVEKAKHERIKRQQSELKLARDEGRLYEATVVERVMTEQLVGLRTNLMALGAKMAPRVEGRSRAEIAQLIDQEIEELLTNLSEYKPELFSIEEEDAQ